jgi:hypothetical protein
VTARSRLVERTLRLRFHGELHGPHARQRWQAGTVQDPAGDVEAEQPGAHERDQPAAQLDAEGVGQVPPGGSLVAHDDGRGGIGVGGHLWVSWSPGGRRWLFEWRGEP